MRCPPRTPPPPPPPSHPTAPPQVSQLRARRAPPRFKTLDDAFSNASYGTSLLLISCSASRPCCPSQANYIFGLSPVPFTAFSLGTSSDASPPSPPTSTRASWRGDRGAPRRPHRAPEPRPPCRTRRRALRAPPSIAPALAAHAQIADPHPDPDLSHPILARSTGGERDALVVVGIVSTIAAISVAGAPALPSPAPRASPRAPRARHARLGTRLGTAARGARTQ